MSDFDDYYELSTTPERVDAMVAELLWELRKAKPYSRQRLLAETQLKVALTRFLAHEREGGK